MVDSRLEQQGSVPVPDPTKLTTDAVEAAKVDIEKLFNTKLNGEVAVITEKFASRDLALAAALKAAQELVKQQNDSNTLANDKMSEGFTKQIESLDEKIDDLKDRVSEMGRKDFAVVGAYIVGAAGIIGLIITALEWHH